MTTKVEAPPGMVLVPEGPFLYGTEKREVTLPAFFVDVVPVTNLEWLKFCEATSLAPPPHWPATGKPSPELEDCPVVEVAFGDVQAYAQWAEKQLPTPQQWEKAARGTDGRKYAWGSEFDPKRANTKEAGNGKPVSVKSLARSASPYGCLGMGGNVLEWTTGTFDRAKGSRVLKGGSFRHYLGALAWEYEGDTKKESDCVGFRCVKSLAAVPSGPKE